MNHVSASIARALTHARRHRAFPPALAAIGGALIGIGFWLFVFVLRPHEPIKVSILYRFGDSDYLPLIYSLARGRYSEFMDPATYGQGMLPFPVVSMLPHALAVALFGDAGFVVADFLIGALRGYLLYRILAFTTPRRGVAALAAVAVTVVLYKFGAWGFRYPRPYVTELFLLGALYLSLAFWRDPGGSRRTPALLGLMSAGAAQGDLHGGIGLSVAAALLLVATLWRTGDIRATVRAGVSLGLAFGIAILPLVAQSATVSAEVTQRWGLFEHSRQWSLVFFTTASLLPLLVFVVLPLVPKRKAWPDDALAAVSLLFVTAAVLAPILADGLLGRAIQSDHFADRFGAVTATVAVLCVAVLLLDRVRQRAVLLVLIALATLGCARPLGSSWLGNARVTTQARVFPGEFDTVPTYRRDLDALWTELKQPRYSGAKRLGTFDQQLAMLWTTGAARSLYVPDTFLSLARDRVIEGRALALLRLCGASRPQVAALLDGGPELKYFQLRFISLTHWIASPRHLAAAPDAYAPEQLARILTVDQREDWRQYFNVELPVAEKARLLTAFDAGAVPDAVVPDVVILTDTNVYRTFPGPPTERYRLTFRNASFRVYLRGGAGR